MLDDRTGLRRFFPRRGPCYECFDTSMFLFFFAVVGYVLTSPPPAVTAALSAPLHVVTETQLGWVLAAASLVGIVCSYLPDYIGLGFLVPRIAAAFLTLNFVVSFSIVVIDYAATFAGWNFLPADVDTMSVLRSAFLYALIFGWATRRLSRDYDE